MVNMEKVPTTKLNNGIVFEDSGINYKGRDAKLLEDKILQQVNDINYLMHKAGNTLFVDVVKRLVIDNILELERLKLERSKLEIERIEWALERRLTITWYKGY